MTEHFIRALPKPYDLMTDDERAAFALRIAIAAKQAASDAPLVVVHEHGEIGPVLTVPGQHFSGPGDH